MKKRIFKYTLWISLLLFGVGMFSLNADYLAFSSSLPELKLEEDTLPGRYPVAKTTPEEYQDIVKQSPLDLRDPENVKTSIEYDIRTGTYIVRTKLGDMELGVPMPLTPEEYQDYSLQQSLRSYFRQKNEEEFQKEANKEFNVTDMQFGIGAAERIFGPGGVRVKTQGSAELTLGMKRNTTKDPSLPEHSRSRTFLNFDESVQLNVQAYVGSKVNFDMNYNTESSFDFDSKKLKLAYTGEEDEIIKRLEAGNVSMTTNNSLIRGGAALFGIKADLQFGKLRVNTLFAQQESESRTVNSNGGVQTKPFELTADQYEENRNFFMGHYFYGEYDNAMSQLPYINSSIDISRIEVWVTNKRANFDNARNIVAFADLAEYRNISNPGFVQPSGSLAIPYNEANTLYKTLVESYQGARNINTVTQTLGDVLEGGKDYVEIGNARLLDASEYSYNRQLGYLSLKTQLQADEVLAVAYQYKYKGTVYQVGEFSTDNATSTTACLYVKLLKGITMSPNMPFWRLMMKNIYSLGAYNVQKEKFKLDILYQSDTAGTYVNYISEGNIKDELLIRVMNLDRLNSNNEKYPDGFYDFVDGYTINAESGKIIFPVVEPFGSHLRAKIGNDAIADKYVYQELYDSTLTYARQIAEKNKFIFSGEYKASSAAEIQLGATNVAPGSVNVTAAGAILTENVDYVVDYTSGVVTILNESIISGGTPVSVTLENRSVYNMQRKTMLGLDLNYQFNPNFNIGATIMHLSEMPLTVKTSMGDEAIKNTLWGLNTSYKTESQWLTNVFDKLPLLTLTKPSHISFNAEFAHLIAGHYENDQTGGYSYLDDFESTQTGINLQPPYSWNLASTPYDDATTALFPEANKINDIEYGKNRALFSWYYIDGIFTRRNSTQVPKHISKDDLSNHYVRAVEVDELFPYRQRGANDASTLPVLNVAYYPNERGPYNLDAGNINPDGTLANPESRWGGMMREIKQSDFETANIEYIEFWMLDPFIYNQEGKGGDLYFNLGEISEDILKDERSFFENGLPADGDLSKIDTTVWGRVPRQQSTVYAFDNTAGARDVQDVGLNGLSTEDEKEYPTYAEYLQKLQARLSGDAYQKMLDDPFSPLNDPAGDNYHYFRGTYYDEQEADILTRYKRYNGTEGNSRESGGRYDMSARTTPDVEDVNQDNTLNKTEKYYEYKISIRPEDLTQVGSNNIVEIRETTPTLANGTNNETVKWYLFKVPVKKGYRSIGSISDFKTIRFMRMYMTGFSDPTVLRFATLELVRGEWRVYEQDLSNPNQPPLGTASLEVSTVNIEENGDREPVNYLLPPGITRQYDAGQPQLRHENEQSLSLKMTNLSSQDARAVYKTTFYDLRQYKRLQLFTHAEELPRGDAERTPVENNELSVFLRLGSDYKNNYYEYEVPLTLTPHEMYTDNPTNRQIVWPEANMLDFKLEALTDLKLNRNKAKREGTAGVTFQTVYSETDPDNPRNTIRIVGNPSLSNVKTIMIGVRNNSKDIKSAEIWVNELRLTDFDEDGGWAANASLNVALSDLGTVNLSGRYESAGFGGLDQSLAERRLEDYAQYNISTSLELGKFFPEKTKVSIPMYYAYSKETLDPKYNPLDQDIKLSDALEAVSTKAEKDSIKSYAQTKTTIKSIAFNNVKVDIKSKNPMPYDPANFSLGYSYSENSKKNPETEYETTKDYRANFTYNYSPYVKPYRPFAKIKKQNGYTRYIKQLAINYVPNNISFQTAMMRNYYEIQLRDLTNTTGTSNIPVSFSQNFEWDRAFSLTWNLTNNLSASFRSGTNARIEEPHVQVNKELNPDQYKVWKDSVKQSIKDLGTPMEYDQSLLVTWNMPLSYIPVLDWVNSTVSYAATYNWERGALSESADIEIGNTIKNQRQIDWQGNLNMQSLYNKNKFLKKVNQRFSGSTRQSLQKKKPVKVERDVQLNPDSGTIVRHNLLTKKLRVKARGANGKTYSVKFKPVDYANVMILNQDTANVKLTFEPGPPLLEGRALDIAEYTTRFLMMVRRINVQYTVSDGMMLPGFRPEIGDIFGQRNYGTLAPGLGFAFGSVDRGYIDKAVDQGWLLMDENNINPAMMNHSKNLNIRADLEPVTGLKIGLNALRQDTRNTEIQFMYDGMPEVQGGNFTMTTIAIGSAFTSKGNSENGYASKTFNKFLENRNIIADRLEGMYAGMEYPNAGFLNGTSYAGQEYNPERYGGVNKNSSDVLIPAFIAAYTGKKPKSMNLSPFPSLKSLLPNWRITYDGLIRIPAVKKYFKSMVLSHQYRCSYSVGTFSSFLNWVDAGKDGLGFIRDIQTGNPTPSSPYEIASVAITEGFSPLFGVDATLLNNISGKVEYRKTRNLSLNISSYQIVESFTDEVVVGVGYKLTEFNKVLKTRKTQNFSNDLTLRMDFSYRKMQSLLRKIEGALTQATSGTIAKTLQFSADYGVSRSLTLRAFYDLQINEPLISSASFPTTNSNYGVSIRFSLAQ